MQKALLFFVFNLFFSTAYATRNCETTSGVALLNELNRRMGRENETVSLSSRPASCEVITTGHNSNLCDAVADRTILGPTCRTNLTGVQQSSYAQALTWQLQAVPVQCFTSAMDDNPPFSYTSCTGRTPAGRGQRARGGTRVAGGSRPCIDGEYVSNMWVAFHDVARCFNIDPKLMWPIIARESKFHMNARSDSGAQCAGQLTAAGYSGVIAAICDPDNDIQQINRVNTIGGAILRRGAGRRTGTSCTPHDIAVDEDLVPPTDPRRSVCDRVKNNMEVTRDFTACALTQNPYTCLTYAFTHLNRDLATTRAIMDQERARSPARPAAAHLANPANRAIVEDLIKKVAAMSYNAGNKPLLLLQEFLRSRTAVPGPRGERTNSLAFKDFLDYAVSSRKFSTQNLEYIMHVQEEGTTHGGGSPNAEGQVINDCSNI